MNMSKLFWNRYVHMESLSSMRSIIFLFPGRGNLPCGGLKVIYEYANRLAQDGFQVGIVYAGSLFWKKKSLYFKLTNCIRYVQYYLLGFSGRKWFPLDRRVKEYFAFSLNYAHVPKADIYIGTNPYTAMYLKDYPISQTKKFYFIQGYENWGDVTDKILRETYHYPLNKIVISTWLQKIMTEEGVACELVPNGFDFNSFHCTIPIQNKNKFKITMIYSPIPNKGCEYGLEALSIVKEKFPKLQVVLFGSPNRPAKLPEWYEYHKHPDKKLHNKILNESAIFIATSIQEGWGLPIGEAMICGAAVVCTNNRGYKEMAIDGYNALLAPVRDSKSLAEHIIRLIENDELRFRIAENGNHSIQKFGLYSSYNKLKRILSHNI